MAMVGAVSRDDDDVELTEEELEGLVLVQTDKSNSYQSRRTNRSRNVSVLLALAFLSVVLLIHFQGGKNKRNYENDIEAKNNEVEEGEEHHDATDSDDASVDWYKRHQVHGTRVQKAIDQWKKDNRLRLLSLTTRDSDIPELEEITEKIKVLLKDQSLVLIGDSTVRYLYGALVCLLDGIIGDRFGTRCEQRQKELKQACREANNTNCDYKATFTNGFDASMEHIPYYQLGKFRRTIKLMETFEMTPDKIIFVGMPCLHSLWSPGSREPYVSSYYPEWSKSFQDFYQELEPFDNWMLGMPVTLSEEKLGTELTLVNWYLKGIPFNATDPESQKIMSFFLRGRPTLLPRDYSGPIPVLDDRRRNHTCDNALFDSVGLNTCTLLGLQMAPPDVPIVDIQSATASASDDTVDGRHYSHGLALRKQLYLILIMMKQQRRENQK